MRLSHFTLFAAFLFLLSPCFAEEEQEQPQGYAQIWIDKSAQLEAGAISKMLADLEQQSQDPDEIIVFIHGFKKPREGSTRDFSILAERVRAEFSDEQTSLGLVGLQWDSSTPFTRASGASKLKMIRAYREAIPLARSVGRGPAREVLLTLQEKYPKAHLSVLAHSMGCELSAAALLPETNYEEYVPFVETYKPEEAVQLAMLVLAGSDLDYDFWYKSKVSPRSLEGRAQLFWLTVADYFEKGDKVLNTRRRIRGRAGGSSFPRMTLEQLDQTVSERRLFIDHRNIPRHHQFLKYYEAPRLSRIFDALRYLHAARAPQPDAIAELDEILAAPNKLEELLPYLDRPNYTSKFFALWRIERILCGDARHMTDDTLDDIIELLRRDPSRIPLVRTECPCLTVRKGIFPTRKAMTGAGILEDAEDFEE